MKPKFLEKVNFDTWEVKPVAKTSNFHINSLHLTVQFQLNNLSFENNIKIIKVNDLNGSEGKNYLPKKYFRG